MRYLHQLTLTILVTFPSTLAQLEYLQCADDVPSTFPNPQATWSPWTKIEGPDLSSEPTAATRDGDDIEVFVCARSAEAGRWVNFQGTWSSYQTLQSGISSVPYPVVDDPSGSILLFAKSLSDSLVSIPCFNFRCTYFWTDHSGVLLHAPTGVSFEPNRVDVFVVNTGRSVSWRTFNDGVPEPSWKSLPNPGVLVRKLAALSRIAGSIDLFGIGTDNRIYHRSYTNANELWTNWVRIHERRVKSAPAVVSIHPLRIDLFVRGEADDLLQTSWVNGEWSGFSSLGGALTSAPGAVARTAGRIDVFVRGTDMKLYQRSYA